MAWRPPPTGNGAAGCRDATIAVYLSHRRTTATMRQLAAPFGLSHPESLNNLVRRAEKELSQSNALQRTVVEIERLLSRPEE